MPLSSLQGAMCWGYILIFTMLDKILGWLATSPEMKQIKVEASITDVVREFAFV